MKRPRRSKPAESGDASHALVGGWTQRRGKFLHLLLGVREGRQRKLRFVGEVAMPNNDLAMSFLEDQLRQLESESSPFIEALPDSGAATRHWTAPELVAEIAYSGWTKSSTLSQPDLRTVSERAAFRRARWVKPPE